MLGIDLDSVGDETLSFAFDTAAVRGAPLKVVYAWWLPEPVVRDEQQRALTAVLRPWRDKYPGLRVTDHLVSGRAAHRLLMAADDASLVVVGHRASAGPRLGPVTHSVIHHATCPVAVVPHSDPAGRKVPVPPGGGTS